MSLYNRGHIPHLGNQRTNLQINKGLLDIQSSNPLSNRFVSPITQKSVTQLFSYFNSIQKKRYGKVLEIPELATKGHIKRALGQHTPEQICRAIKLASWISEYPFSIPFAIKTLESHDTTIRSHQDTETDNRIPNTRTLFD